MFNAKRTNNDCSESKSCLTKRQHSLDEEAKNENDVSKAISIRLVSIY